MRMLLLALLAGVAAAQQPMSAPQPPAAPTPERYEIVAHPSPEFTQDRVLPGTRFWLLDPGHKEVQFWYRPEVSRAAHDTSHLMQLEVEVGLVPHVQLDVYENVIKEPGRDFQHEGNQIEARIAAADYGRIWANPVLYLEWHPRDAEDKVEIRALLGGEAAPGVLVAVNPFWEQQVQGEDVREWGATAAVSAAVHGNALRVGLEAKAAFERAGGETEQSYLVGPNLFAKALGDRLKLMLTVFMGLNDQANALEPILIVGSEL
jgi:hypothetical protein